MGSTPGQPAPCTSILTGTRAGPDPLHPEHHAPLQHPHPLCLGHIHHLSSPFLPYNDAFCAMKLMETSRAPLQTQFGALGWGHGTFVPQVPSTAPQQGAGCACTGELPSEASCGFSPLQLSALQILLHLQIQMSIPGSFLCGLPSSNQ